MRLYGSVNVGHQQETQMSGSVDVGSKAVTDDVVGESRLYGIVNTISVTIDVVPAEIKYTLMQAGVKFS